MRLRFPLIVALLLALIAPAAARAYQSEDAAKRTAPVPGTVALGAKATDPHAGAEWAVRVWRPKDRQRFDRDSRCLQAGRVAGAGLDRPLGAGARALELGDRTICGAADIESSQVVLVERLVDDPGAADPRLVRTVVAGLAPPRANRVVVEVRGRPRALPVRRGTFLAVLPGDIRRADLVIRFPGERLDFARGGTFTRADAPVPNTIRVALEQPDPEGGRPLALLTYATRKGDRCGEPVRLLAGEAGHYQPAWGSFADAPTVVDTTGFEDHWEPGGSPPSTIDSCTWEEHDSLIEGLGVRRMSSSQVVVHGLLRRDVTGLEVLDPSASAVAVARGSGAFLAAVPSRGVFGEHLDLTVTRRDGRRFTRGIQLGNWAHPTTFSSYELRGSGRILRIWWTGGFEPFLRADVVEARDRVLVTVFDRYPPSFAPDGIGYGIRAIAIVRCFDVRLARPLGARTVRDGAAAGRRRPGTGTPRPFRSPRCTRVGAPAS